VIGPQTLAIPIRSFRFAPFLGKELGPLSMVTSLSVAEDFTDNANQTKNNRQSQFSTSIAPAVAFHFDRGVTTLDLAYAPSFFIPNTGPRETTWNQDLSLRGSWQPSAQIRLGITQDLTKSNNFQAVGDITSRRTGQQSFIANTASANVSYSHSPWQATLSYVNGYSLNDVPGGDTSRTNSVRAGVDLSNPGYTLGGSYSLSRGDFNISPSSYWAQSAEAHASHPFTPRITGTLSASFGSQTPDVGQDFAIYGANAGAVMALTPDSTLSVSMGPQVFAPRGSPSSITPSTSISYTKQFAHFSLSAQYTNGLQTNFTAINNTGVTQTRAASVSLATSTFRDLTASLAGIYAESNFKQTTVAGAAAGTTDRTWNANLAIQYSLLRWLSLSLGYTFTIRTSTEATAGFYENNVRLALTAQYTPF